MSRGALSDEIIQTLFKAGRHVGIQMFITSQAVMGLDCDSRSQTEWVFLCRTSNIKMKKKMHSEFCGNITYPQFELIMSQLEPFELLAVRKHPNITGIQESIFLYKPERHGNFKIGSYAYWQCHKQNYNAKYDDDDEEEDEPGQFRIIPGLKI